MSLVSRAPANGGAMRRAALDIAEVHGKYRFELIGAINETLKRGVVARYRVGHVTERHEAETFGAGDGGQQHGYRGKQGGRR